MPFVPGWRKAKKEKDDQMKKQAEEIIASVSESSNISEDFSMLPEDQQEQIIQKQAKQLSEAASIIQELMKKTETPKEELSDYSPYDKIDKFDTMITRAIKNELGNFIEVLINHGKNLHETAMNTKNNLSPKDRDKLLYSSISLGELIKCLKKFVTT